MDEGGVNLVTDFLLTDKDGVQRFRGSAAGGATPETGADSPVGVVTPQGIGALYIDETHGALYVAAGVTSADWIALGGTAGSNGIGDVIGVVSRTGEIYLLGGIDPDTPLNGNGPILTDAYAQWNGNGAGLRIVGDGTDGNQRLVFQNAAGATTLHGTEGAMQPFAGVVFPSANPHVAGAWWDNAGTLTRSAG